MTATEPSLQSVSVSAPSRLHFGLIAIGNETKRKFGGAGLMIAQPRTEITVRRCEQPSISDHEDSAIRIAAERWLDSLAPPEIREQTISQLPVSISATTTSRHRGLGSGTQIAFGVAAALNQLFCGVLPGAEELAHALDRGKRSAIGSHGFVRGGFLVDRGIGEHGLAPLDAHLAFPESWPIVLIEPIAKQSQPVFGEKERAAFSSLPPTAQSDADVMIDLLKNNIVPAVAAKHFDDFAAGLTEYGIRSGKYFQGLQGSAFSSPWAENTVRRIRDYGNFGVGQSSWGPTLYAVCQSQQIANHLAGRLSQSQGDSIATKTTITTADNQGARWTTE